MTRVAVPSGGGTDAHQRLTRRVKRLEGQLRQKNKKLADSVALLELLVQAAAPPRRRHGRFHDLDERRRRMALIERAKRHGAQLDTACHLLGLSARTVQPWRKTPNSGDNRPFARRRRAHRLSSHERRLVLEPPGFARHRGLSSRQLVPRLADQGLYGASESTFYRLKHIPEKAGRP